MIKELIQELEKCQEAKELLEEVFYQLGPYTSTLDTVTLRKLQSFFAFDDSE